MGIKDRANAFGITKYKRIENYIKEVKESFKLTSKKDRELVDEIEEIIEVKIKKLKKLYILNKIFYIGIYFSFISVVFSNFYILSDFLNLIGKIFAFFGTTFFIIAIFVVTRLKELLYQDLNLLASHLISTYNQNKMVSDTLFEEEENGYKHFIDFLKKRGY